MRLRPQTPLRELTALPIQGILLLREKRKKRKKEKERKIRGKESEKEKRREGKEERGSIFRPPLTEA